MQFLNGAGGSPKDRVAVSMIDAVCTCVKRNATHVMSF